MRRIYKEKAQEIWENLKDYKGLIKHLKSNWINQIYHDYESKIIFYDGILDYFTGKLAYNQATHVFEIYIYISLSKRYTINECKYIALALYRKYKKPIERKMITHFKGIERNFYEKDKVRVWKEFIARGFIPKECCKNINFQSNHYIQANIGGLVYNKPFNNFQDAYEFRDKIGILGWCGIISPKY